ncbi:MAG: hypothetical protein ACYCO5_01245 [Acidobacteriaceae bacterium]
MKKLAHTLLETIRYLGLNADSMPDCGQRYYAGQRASTGFVESAVNEIVAKRMVNRQQTRWNRYAVQRFLGVRVHALNATLGKRIPSLAQRLPACRRPNPTGPASTTNPQLYTLSPFPVPPYATSPSLGPLINVGFC